MICVIMILSCHCAIMLLCCPCLAPFAHNLAGTLSPVVSALMLFNTFYSHCQQQTRSALESLMI
ncbi:hypothetical protein BOTBODRAFT_288317 [Botryobasidium botryosum FD-172 SS1]|uniref:Uncharacterized protein n=1 Tax=Botryobasidium botryosum (strain FD-172 SS1) TaxID=930990 RepID=A0A067M2T8_BOTB1|nr:hypothetical protein BOTBODRAFT_288317 [Botryobasidium botryosum FD-172 SS1]